MFSAFHRSLRSIYSPLDWSLTRSIYNALGDRKVIPFVIPEDYIEDDASVLVTDDALEQVTL